MDITTLPPIAAVLDAAYSLVVGFVGGLDPLFGSSAAGVAVILITICVRTLLIPVGISQVRAEFTRRHLAPKLAELRRRFGKNPELLQRKTMALYAEEKASPLAGCLPLLLQAPVLSTLYALFAFSVVAGHANALLDETFLGTALGDSLFAAITGSVDLLAHAIVLGVIVVVALLSRSTTIAFAATAPAAGDVPAAFAPGGPLSWLALATVVVAAVVPLAAALYLAVSSSWTLGERVLLRRVLAPR
ncbi:membrane protein insertase YidC [Salinibacterium sp. SYSU T00001]|uniref:YidC/Oxa1 family membrane protein insertase n=1 Tax=Homoserinimonas sedimenticola TaxID=2986805 RepID=UPI002236010F|nr:membrane protein insertase YidC [Salinibacterium sedimenticola]MCW4384792.1 membrane protein insertase YidC [Salinibacterium sedimenticola]